MKKILLLGAVLAHSVGAFAQTQRTLLFEEFSGENCGPCAAVNPSLNNFIAQYPTDVILLKYQVNIPSAGPLYYQNPSEAYTRMNYYGVNSAPWGEQDGLSWTSQGNHPGYWIQTTEYADDRLAVASPFNLAVTHSFSADADSFFATVNISGAEAYTVSSAGKLKLRVAMIEDLSFATPIGTNGETQFHHVMRKMYPNATGTTLANTWTVDSNRTFSFSGRIPSYIYDKTNVRFVAFIQDDSTKEVQQSAISTEQAFPNDAKVAGIVSGFYSCSADYSPVVTLNNKGTATLSSANLDVYIDNALATEYNWTGSLSSEASINVTIPAMSGIAQGIHAVKVVVTDPNGVTDVNNGNDTTVANFAIGAAVAATAPLVEGFEDGTPAGWAVETPAGDTTWLLANTGNNSSKSYEFDFYYVAPDVVGYLYLPRLNLSGYDRASISFDRAYAQYNTSIDDELSVEVSSDCGSTWQTVWDKSGSNLATTSATTNPFTPTTAAAWVTDSASLNAVAGRSNVLVRFKGLSGYGNNAYIDNVNVYQFGNVITGIKNVTTEMLYSVYPNPTNDKLNVDISSEESTDVHLQIFNQLGQVVISSNKQLTSGLNQIAINTSTLAQGSYVIQFTSGTNSSVKKFNIVR